MRIIISPSGKLYGSENVLFDYLNYTKLRFDTIYVPYSSALKQKIDQSNIKVKGFNNLKWLYLKLLIKIVSSKVNRVYLNEAGHIRYIYFLAILLPRVEFVVHVRILEDTPRIIRSMKNLKVIAISKTIQKKIIVLNQLIYDGYHFGELKTIYVPNTSKLRIGIVGRITASKGLDLLTCKFLSDAGSNLDFHFFGDVDREFEKDVTFQLLYDLKNVHFHGFITDKNRIYSNIDVLLHVNTNEPLGRIFFESLDFGVPFIGINQGGIAEIANLISYPYVFEKKELLQKLRALGSRNWTFDQGKIENSRKKAYSIFSIIKYTDQIDRIIS